MTINGSGRRGGRICKSGYRSFCLAAVAALLAACAATPDSQYYTLSPQAAQAPVPAAASRLAYAISVQPVTIPAQVDKPQIVIATRQEPSRLQPLNQSLWAAPLSDEIRHALADDLSRQLGVPDIPLGTQPGGLPVWRVDFTVNRFDSIYGQAVVLEATWRLTNTQRKQGHPLVCKGLARVAVQQGVPALVGGQQLALLRFARLMAQQISGQANPVEPGVELEGCT